MVRIFQHNTNDTQRRIISISRDFYEIGSSYRYCIEKDCNLMCHFCSSDRCLSNWLITADLKNNEKDVYESIIAIYPEKDFWDMVADNNNYYDIHI